MASYEQPCPCGSGVVVYADPSWRPDYPVAIRCEACRATHEIHTTPGGIDRKGGRYDRHTELRRKAL